MAEFYGWLKEYFDENELPNDLPVVIVENWTDPNDDWPDDADEI